MLVDGEVDKVDGDMDSEASIPHPKYVQLVKPSMMSHMRSLLKTGIVGMLVCDADLSVTLPAESRVMVPISFVRCEVGGPPVITQTENNGHVGPRDLGISFTRWKVLAEGRLTRQSYGTV